MFCSQNLHAQNKEWNIYKNFDYWKYPTIAITRNTSLEGHRIRTEITCSGTYLSAKLIYSYPSNWENTDIRKKLILEKIKNVTSTTLGSCSRSATSSMFEIVLITSQCGTWTIVISHFISVKLMFW